jgi:hypothetical protein
MFNVRGLPWKVYHTGQTRCREERILGKRGRNFSNRSYDAAPGDVI